MKVAKAAVLLGLFNVAGGGGLGSGQCGRTKTGSQPAFHYHHGVHS